MPDSLGTRLRQRREQQHIALSAIAEQTKITLSLLDGLERDDISRWPTGIFRRAFVRAYAHAVGLNADEVLREFVQLHPDPTVDFAPVAGTRQADAASAGRASPTRLRDLLGSALGSWAPGARKVKALGGEAPAAGNLSVAARAEPAPSGPDLSATSHLCTELARLSDLEQAEPVLAEAAALFDAVGLVVWVPDAAGAELLPTLTHGYSSAELQRLPRVQCDADNATAAAYRTSQTSIVSGSQERYGALALPLLTPSGCAGVLAVELRHRGEQLDATQALATIFAAQLARLLPVAPEAAAVSSPPRLVRAGSR